jgi:hypothetical protein
MAMAEGGNVSWLTRTSTEHERFIQLDLTTMLSARGGVACQQRGVNDVRAAAAIHEQLKNAATCLQEESAHCQACK